MIKDNSAKIIIVDNYPKAVDWIKDTLNDKGYIVEIIDSISNAKIKLQENSYDIIILDMIMGEDPEDHEESLEFLDYISNKHDPLIKLIITAHGKDKEQYFLDKGADAFFEKSEIVEKNELFLEKIEFLLSEQKKVIQDVLKSLSNGTDEAFNRTYHVKFDSDAILFLKNKITECVNNVAIRAISISKQNDSSTVTDADVRRAIQFCAPPPKKPIVKHLGTVGGILLGAFLSNMLSMINEGFFPFRGNVVNIIVGIAGTITIVLYIVKS